MGNDIRDITFAVHPIAHTLYSQLYRPDHKPLTSFINNDRRQYFQTAAANDSELLENPKEI